MALRRPGPQVLEPEPLCFAADFSQPAERQAKPGIQSDTDNHGSHYAEDIAVTARGPDCAGT
jgi:hypothetical protein